MGGKDTRHFISGFVASWTSVFCALSHEGTKKVGSLEGSVG